MRFTLSKLFLAITMLALACAGMTIRSRGWADSIVSLTIVLYLAVALFAASQTGPQRRFCIAFAAVGTGYLLLILCNVFTPIRSALLTDRLLVFVARSTNLHLQTGAWAQPTIPLYMPTAIANSSVPVYAPPPSAISTPAYPANAEGSPPPASVPIPTTTSPAIAPTPAPGSPSTADPDSGSPPPSSPPAAMPPTYVAPTSYVVYDSSLEDWSQQYTSLSTNHPVIAFLTIGHCVFSCLIALLAGWFCASLYARR